MRNISNDRQEQQNVPKPEAAQQNVAPLSPRSSLTAHEPATTRLRTPLWPIIVVLFYAAITLTSWVLLCIMSKRPFRGMDDYYDDDDYYDRQRQYLKANENCYKAAEILQTIAALLTIPVTSIICSVACVAYMQAASSRKSLNLRKIMALADQGWLSPRILWDRLPETGCLPLYIALGLTLIGK